MKKLIFIMMVGMVFGQCILEDSIQSLRTSLYGIGDTISLEHQLIEFDVCYGEYENSIFKIADFNYNLNGGHYKVSMLRINATW